MMTSALRNVALVVARLMCAGAVCVCVSVCVCAFLCARWLVGLGWLFRVNLSVCLCVLVRVHVSEAVSVRRCVCECVR